MGSLSTLLSKTMTGISEGNDISMVLLTLDSISFVSEMILALPIFQAERALVILTFLSE